jgi:hypothetical protein
MNRKNFLLLPFTALWIIGAGHSRLQAASITEPARIVYGKVVKMGHGGTYQLFSGTLCCSLVNSANPAQVIPVSIPLRRAGANGEFSYRIEIDQNTLPAADLVSSTLVVGTAKTTYSLQSITVDGYPASLLDPSQAAEFATSYVHRAIDLRFDFKADVPLADTDLDGMPDWWEDLYGLNRLSNLDAALDADGDGWNNLQEFLQGTDPDVANTRPVLQDSLLVVSAGGSAGVYLPIVDTDSTTANILLTIVGATPGLIWHRSGTALPPGTSFTQADMLAGQISLDVAADFQTAAVQLTLVDKTAANPSTQELSLQVEAFSPMLRWLADPLVWLDAGQVGQDAAVTEWPDRSVGIRNGYQPYAAASPVSDGGGHLGFGGKKQYLYLDDKEMVLNQFTAFVAYDLNAETGYDQTLFNSSDLELSVGGPDAGNHARSLRVTQNGRTISGPLASAGQSAQLSLTSSDGLSVLHVPDQGTYPSVTSGDCPLSSFTTLGGEQTLGDAEAGKFLNGNLREVLIYERVLPADARLMIEDYQQSRWSGIRVWNYRSATFPVTINGYASARNIINGGGSSDVLVGGDQDDVLRGGPGDNRLTGGAGADRFYFEKNSSNNVVTDVSATAGDVIDLSGVFAGKTGLPSQFIKIKTVVTRGANNIPRVDSILQLIHEGTGTVVDQSITLQGVAIGTTDLARLVGQGSIQLGGPHYESGITLAVAAVDPSKPSAARQVTVHRTGNLDAAVKVPLNFAGTAGIGQDFEVEGTKGTGAVRTLLFASGVADGAIRIVPKTTRQSINTTLQITALPVLQASSGSVQSLAVELPGNSQLAIRTLRNIDSQLGTAGWVRISRDGGLSQSFDVGLSMSGTLVNGRDINLPTSVHFAANQASFDLSIPYLGAAVTDDTLPGALIAVNPAPDTYQIQAPGQTSVLLVTRGGAAARMSFESWFASYFPGNTNTTPETLDPDGDDRPNIIEYLTGTNPTVADGGAANLLSIATDAEGFELVWKSPRALTDVLVGIEESRSLGTWQPSSCTATETRRFLTDSSIERRYRINPTAGVNSRFFRLAPSRMPAASIP